MENYQYQKLKLFDDAHRIIGFVYTASSQIVSAELMFLNFMNYVGGHSFIPVHLNEEEVAAVRSEIVFYIKSEPITREIFESSPSDLIKLGALETLRKIESDVIMQRNTSTDRPRGLA